MWYKTPEDAVLKLCLNRSEQARNTKELQEICGLGIYTGLVVRHKFCDWKNSSRTCTSSPDTGKASPKEFVEKRLHQREILVHDTVKRCKFQNFTSMAKKRTAKNKKSIVDVTCDILAKLLAIYARKGKIIDFEKALKYPLGDIPLTLENPDGTMMKTNKGQLFKIIFSRMETEPLPNFPKQKTAFIVDVMALIRTM